ncbi:MAG: TonB-dependent receptor, partial [Bacteroidales bacterium]|nr:TonB-dependent receptor [Bacteroidales bacterium]
MSFRPGLYYKYASQALNGINKSLEDKLLPGMENIIRPEFEFAGKNIAFLAGMSYKWFNDIDAAESIGKLSPNGYKEIDLDAKLYARITTNQYVTALFQKSTQIDVPLFHKIVSGDYSVYSFSPQDRILTYLRHEIYFQNNLLRKITTTASYQKSLEFRQKQKSGSLNWAEEEDIADVYGFNVELFSMPKPYWKINTSFEIYHDLIQSQTEEFTPDQTQIVRGLYPDNSRFTTIGASSMHSFDFEKWNIQAGIRYNKYLLSVTDTLFGNTKLQPEALVGNIGITRKLGKHFSFILSANTGFRSPNINDVSSFGIADFRYEVPSANLKPEKSITYELGLKQKHRFLQSSVFIFRTDLYDLITNVRTSYLGADSVLLNNES